MDTIAIPGVPAASSDLFRPDAEAVADLVAQAVPFPTGVDRPRTRLVNGVDGDPALTAQAASELVRAGAEVAVIANADSFDQERTAVVYFAPRFAERAEALAEALGGARAERGDVESSTVDVVVVLGADYVGEASGDGDVPTDSTIAVTPTTIPFAGDEGVTPGAPGGELPG